jgi:hypothetical protein
MTGRFRPAIPVWVVIILGILTVLVAVFISWPRDRLALDQQAWTFCEQGYAKARAAAGSQMVDAQRPVLSRGHSMVALTCGAMRTARHPRPSRPAA